ncbi:MAG TPA: NAD(P)-dependent oxidoreductase [Burkholderiaceae bacterium]|nr:NAD(P)-dependent oxidoreductase [Burkholderiaceae bacterium]HMX09543.1 NAD(P)-dependent oxidoreductase [Burkholderiaceae bacterium]HNB43316.1 NAD(P)-dependent oxidoreductase [Burkholderiaceae bacterium]HNG79733.1 NAD(P)-dependent oxidoreductase [Burkholderiaceae bacterium]
MLPRPASPLRFGRLLLTGAAGNLGRELRPRLKAYCETLRLSHRSDTLGAAGEGEEIAIADLADRAAVMAALEGVDAVVHMGGVSTEQPWEDILAGNIVGMVNLYEAARAQGVKRIVFASSNHVTGFYRQDEVISPCDPVRPDGFYGLSKCFGENLAQLYWDRHGIETVSLRIGSAYAAPKDRRMLATWMSFDDTERLIVAALTAPVVRHSVIYGLSDNATAWWDNTPARHIGYRPQDSSEAFRAEVEARQPTLDASDPAVQFQGGAFVRTGPFFRES